MKEIAVGGTTSLAKSKGKVKLYKSKNLKFWNFRTYFIRFKVLLKYHLRKYLNLPKSAFSQMS